MFIGHLPSAYIVTKLATDRLSIVGLKRNYIMIASMVGAIAPDLDMIYFYLFDKRQHHHHTYWTHLPVVWFMLLLLTLAWYKFAPKTINAFALLTFFSSGIFHLILDTIVSEVWWFAPFYDQPYMLFTVPSLYTPWWYNFILHWSFGLEITITIGAVWLWYASET